MPPGFSVFFARRFSFRRIIPHYSWSVKTCDTVLTEGASLEESAHRNGSRVSRLEFRVEFENPKPRTLDSRPILTTIRETCSSDEIS